MAIIGGLFIAIKLYLWLIGKGVGFIARSARKGWQAESNDPMPTATESGAASNAPDTPKPESDWVLKLQTLAELRKSGNLSDEEFAEAKRKLGLAN